MTARVETEAETGARSGVRLGEDALSRRSFEDAGRDPGLDREAGVEAEGGRVRDECVGTDLDFLAAPGVLSGDWGRHDRVGGGAGCREGAVDVDDVRPVDRFGGADHEPDRFAGPHTEPVAVA